MLTPDVRALLVESLEPDPGYELDYAVATTFTLDLTATLVPALALSSLGSGSMVKDPVALLKALKDTSTKVDIFCQAGEVGVPHEARELIAFFEDMVHEVRRPQRAEAGAKGLFHPKVWVLRYAGEDGVLTYRTLVLTRNLTHDSSWDLVVRLDSEAVTSDVNEANEPLAALLDGLPGRSIRTLDASRVHALAEEIRHVIWQGIPDAKFAPQFHYLDGSSDAMSRVFEGGDNDRWAGHLVVSPFVQDDGLPGLGDVPVAVVARPGELDRLRSATVATLDDHRLRAVQPMYRLDDVSGYLGSDESDDSGDSAVVGTEQMPLGRLHAKMYISEHWSRLTEDRVIIGSANATGPAFSRNVEFLVEMRGHRKKFGIERFLDDLGELAIPYETGGGAEPDREEDVQRRLDDAVRAVAEARFRVKVQAIGAGPEEGYDLLIVTDEPVGIAAGYTATVSVLGFDSRTMPLTNGERFDGRCRGVSLTQITPLLVVTATDGERTSTSVVIAELDNAPDGRLDAIVAEQLDTPDKFLKFALLMLNFGDRALAGEVLRGGREDSGSRQSSGLLPGSLLDTVLQALATNPEALAELDAVVQAMGKRRKNDANPANEQSTFDWDAFNGFWAEVSAAQKILGEK